MPQEKQRPPRPEGEVCTYYCIFFLEGHTTWRMSVLGRNLVQVEKDARDLMKRSTSFKLFELEGKTGLVRPVELEEEDAC